MYVIIHFSIQRKFITTFLCKNVNTLNFRALPWSEARAHCQALGTDLAEMNTRGEQSGVTRSLNTYRESTHGNFVFYKLLLVSDYGIPFWLGGSLNKRGKWRWVWTESRWVRYPGL